ncbi:hypothetical protein [Methylobacterium organophilum]|uniref:SnoaL-like domain-containing protein n=1 Tax=Methylobacterium organophilum TaxID=410 RepID=A0ABQ4TIA6_METOR|nr:hypothetical protein [Methylobacterium organophilum]GJE29752.1 hypothetical protein LKMONMHP_4638 [Methylobacterium organophilum]
MSAALALTEPQALVASWYAGVRSLDPERVPAPGILWREPGPAGRFGVWAGVHAMMVRFLDQWGEDAARLGWSTESLFGVHRLAGALRPDSTGALVTLYPRRCITICEREIHLERRGVVLVARGLTNPAESIPLWQFGRNLPAA